MATKRQRKQPPEGSGASSCELKAAPALPDLNMFLSRVLGELSISDLDRLNAATADAQITLAVEMVCELRNLMYEGSDLLLAEFLCLCCDRFVTEQVSFTTAMNDAIRAGVGGASDVELGVTAFNALLERLGDHLMGVVFAETVEAAAELEAFKHLINITKQGENSRVLWPAVFGALDRDQAKSTRTFCDVLLVIIVTLQGRPEQTTTQAIQSLRLAEALCECDEGCLALEQHPGVMPFDSSKGILLKWTEVVWGQGNVRISILILGRILARMTTPTRWFAYQWGHMVIQYCSADTIGARFTPHSIVMLKAATAMALCLDNLGIDPCAHVTTAAFAFEFWVRGVKVVPVYRMAREDRVTAAKERAVTPSTGSRLERDNKLFRLAAHFMLLGWQTAVDIAHCLSVHIETMTQMFTGSFAEKMFLNNLTKRKGLLLRVLLNPFVRHNVETFFQKICKWMRMPDQEDRLVLVPVSVMRMLSQPSTIRQEKEVPDRRTGLTREFCLVCLKMQDQLTRSPRPEAMRVLMNLMLSLKDLRAKTLTTMIDGLDADMKENIGATAEKLVKLVRVALDLVDPGESLNACASLDLLFIISTVTRVLKGRIRAQDTVSSSMTREESVKLSSAVCSLWSKAADMTATMVRNHTKVGGLTRTVDDTIQNAAEIAALSAEVSALPGRGIADVLDALIFLGIQSTHMFDTATVMSVLECLMAGYDAMKSFVFHSAYRAELKKQIQTMLVMMRIDDCEDMADNLTFSLTEETLERLAEFASGTMSGFTNYREVSATVSEALRTKKRVSSATDIPAEFIDTISCDVMIKPVKLGDGHTLDVRTAKRHMLTSSLSPFTRKPITLTPDTELEERIRAFFAPSCE